VLQHVDAVDEKDSGAGGWGEWAWARRDDLEAGVARIVLHAGKQVIIANGRTPHVLERIVAGEQVGTLFAPVREKSAMRGRLLDERCGCVGGVVCARWLRRRRRLRGSWRGWMRRSGMLRWRRWRWRLKRRARSLLQANVLDVRAEGGRAECGYAGSAEVG
jgi:hypothetical protein